MGRLSGKTAIITGATGGIGSAAVRRFIEEGARVLAVGRSKEKLQQLKEEIDSDRLRTFVAEAGDEDGSRHAVRAARDHFGGVDILFANAGTEGAAGLLPDSNADAFQEVLKTNVVGVWSDMKHVIPAMKERGGGSIIATSSIAGLIGFPGLAQYVASKHAVIGLVKNAALECGADGIRANAIAPGPVANRMFESIGEQLGGDADEFSKQVDSMIPLGHAASNEDVANLALFLASDESAYTTGAVITTDGGYTAA